ncbi:MAG: histidine--tRNA ligase [Kiritimatiellia bacterium]
MADTAKFQSPRGMRDFYPQDMRLRNCIFDAWRSAAEQSGFEAYDACVVESLDLLKRKAGEEIVDQIYHFKDKSGRDLALRPEITPTLARMVAARQGALSFPLKWYTIGQCFRYERMTRGRKREHYQWNLDIIGEPSVTAEAEILATAVCALQKMGLDTKDFRIAFSSRTLLSALLFRLGIPPEHHQATFLALDKRGKIPDAAIFDLLRTSGLTDDGIPAVLRLLEIRSLEEAMQLLGSDSIAADEMQFFLACAEAHGIRQCLQFDIGVIRGLSYYTGIVFEAFDIRGEMRAIFGGGRYAKLLASIGGGDSTAVGLGFGDVVIAEILADRNALQLDPPRQGYHIAAMESEQIMLATKVTAALRAQGHCANMALAPVKPKTFFAKADNARAAFGILIGPDDVKTGNIRIKDLEARTEAICPLADFT